MTMWKNGVRALEVMLVSVIACPLVLASLIDTQLVGDTHVASHEAAIGARLLRARVAGDTVGEASILEELGSLLRSSERVARPGIRLGFLDRPPHLGR